MAPVSVAYIVKSPRTPNVPNFDNQSEAEAAFEAEVTRCRGAVSR